MARNASGVYALPSSVNPVVGGTPISPDWANTTLQDLAAEITDSLSRSGKGAMTVPLKVADGTVAAPSFTFSNDADCGLYRIGTNRLGLALGGALMIDAAVASTTIANQLVVYNGETGTPGIRFSGDTDSGMWLNGDGDLRIMANAVDIATFTTKLSIAASTAATGGTRQDALSLTNGDLDLSAVTAPTSTTAIANRVTPTNIPKAWATLDIDSGGGGAFTIAVDAGFNVASAARSGANEFTVTFASAFANTNFAVLAHLTSTTAGFGAFVLIPNVVSRTTTTAVFDLRQSNDCTKYALDTTSVTNLKVAVVVFGAQ